MRFLIKLNLEEGKEISLNYGYLLSSAIYKIIQKADGEYASFLHEKGYGKGFKLFTFSDLRCVYRIKGDRLVLEGREVSFIISFHLPDAFENFIKGLFLTQVIEIADNKSKVRLKVSSVESLVNPLMIYKENELINIKVRPISVIVAGLRKEDGKYNYLSPEDTRFTESLNYNWRSKIATLFGEAVAGTALLMMEVLPIEQPFKSRLITIKAGTDAQTKIRGWRNFELKITGEKRFVDLLMNSGVGLYNSQGCGCVEVNLN